MSGRENKTITAFFAEDHDEIDAILKAADFSDAAAALARLREFDRRLERHIVWEEEVLFPAAAREQPGLANGPIAMMRLEHAAIRKSKAHALDLLAGGDGAGARGAVNEMLGVLDVHNMKEERVLYPACDQLLAAGEIADLIDLFVTSARRV